MAENLDSELTRGRRALAASQYEEAVEALSVALEGYRQAGDHRMHTFCLMLVGQAEKARGDLEAARVALEEAARMARDLEDHLEQGDVWTELGLLYLDTGHAARAAEWLQRGVDCSLDGKIPVLAARLSVLGRALKELGRYDEALIKMRQAVKVAHVLSPMNQATAKIHLADLLQFLGEPIEAKRLLDDVLPSFELEGVRIAFRLLAVGAFLTYGSVLRELGDEEAAESWTRRAATVAQEGTPPAFEIGALLSHIDLLHRQDRVEEAGPWCVRAARLARESPGLSPRILANAYLELASNQFLSRKPEAALESLRIAREAAAAVDDRVLEYNLTLVEFEMAFYGWRFDVALEKARRAVELILAAQGSNPLLYGIMRSMRRSVGLFDRAILLAAFWASAWREQEGPLSIAVTFATESGQRRQEMSLSDASEWEILRLMDASRCVYIREGLARYLSSAEEDSGAERWRSAPADWRTAFAGPRRRSRTKSGRQARGGALFGHPRAEALVASSDEPGDELKNRYCTPVDEEQVIGLLDAETVIVQFHFTEDDLWTVPVGLGPHGRPRLLLPPDGVLSHPGTLPTLRDLAARQHAALKTIIGRGCDPWQAERSAGADALAELYRSAWRAIGGDELVEAITRATGRVAAELHLVLVPDGPLCELPLHALVAGASGERLYQRFRSTRYGISLRTLTLQETAVRGPERATPGALRGVLFANPAQAEDYLPGVREEVSRLVEIAPRGWWIHGDTEDPEYRATADNFFARHASGELLWVCGHGLEGADDEYRAFELSLCDRAIGARELLARAYDFRRVEVVVLSSCCLGKVDPGRGLGREIEAYQAILALRGCRRVTSALWPLSDQAATIFAELYYRRLHLLRREPPDGHSFSEAFKTALDEFRACEGGMFDHEFFWAPYTNYGLG